MSHAHPWEVWAVDSDGREVRVEHPHPGRPQVVHVRHHHLHTGEGAGVCPRGISSTARKHLMSSLIRHECKDMSNPV